MIDERANFVGVNAFSALLGLLLLRRVKNEVKRKSAEQISE